MQNFVYWLWKCKGNIQQVTNHDIKKKINLKVRCKNKAVKPFRSPRNTETNIVELLKYGQNQGSTKFNWLLGKKKN